MKKLWKNATANITKDWRVALPFRIMALAICSMLALPFALTGCGNNEGEAIQGETGQDILENSEGVSDFSTNHIYLALENELCKIDLAIENCTNEVDSAMYVLQEYLASVEKPNENPEENPEEKPEEIPGETTNEPFDPDYNLAYVSMFNLGRFDASFLAYYMGYEPLVADEIIGAEELCNGFGESMASSIQYLFGVDPMILWEYAGCSEERYCELIRESFGKMAQDNPNTQFYFIFPAYEISHYASCPGWEIDDMEAAYADFTDICAAYENASFHYYADSEWIYANPYVFEAGSDIALKESPCKTLILEIIAGEHKRTPDEIATGIKNLKLAIDKETTTPATYPNMSDTCVVTLGDSILGLYQDETAIHSVLGNMTGATTVNLAVGGTSASMYEGVFFGGQLDNPALIQSKIEEAGGSGKRLIFVIEFGLNDYFRDQIISNADNPGDVDTFSGSLRTAVEIINTNWPEAEIVFMSPGYISQYDNGNLIFDGPGGNVLEAYRVAVRELASELGYANLDLALDLCFTQENIASYTSDGIHYNQEGRFKIAQGLIKLLATLTEAN